MSRTHLKMFASMSLAAVTLSLSAPTARADEDGKQYSGVECSFISALTSQLRDNGKFRALVRGTVTCPIMREKIASSRVNYAEVVVRGVERTECRLVRTSASGTVTHVPETSVQLVNGHQKHIWFNGGASLALPAGETLSIQCMLDIDDELVNYRMDEDV